jgi:hypothetical protein
LTNTRLAIGFKTLVNYLAIACGQAQLSSGTQAKLKRRPVMDGNIFNSSGHHVGKVLGPKIFDLKGTRLYDLKGLKIYKLSGELVGHLADARISEKRLDKSTDKLFL